jgi:hypothetical protein
LRPSVLGPTTVGAVLMIGIATTLAQTATEAERLREGVKALADRITEQPPLVQDWLRNSETLRATRGEFANDQVTTKALDVLSKHINAQQLRNIREELEAKRYMDLIIIKVAIDDGNVCESINCFGVQPAIVKRIVGAVIDGRDKEESVRAANINSRIAISGAFLAVLSFGMSTWSTVTSLRSKKTGT